jgi:hypothetical protein
MQTGRWPSFMSYLNQELDLQDVSLSTIGGPPDLIVNHLTSCILEAKSKAVPNVLPYTVTNLSLLRRLVIWFASETNVSDVVGEIRTVNSGDLWINRRKTLVFGFLSHGVENRVGLPCLPSLFLNLFLIYCVR